MTIKTFIEKAIEGGWIPYSYDIIIKFPVEAKVEGERVQLIGKGDGNWSGVQSSVKIETFIDEHKYRIFLDPLAWQAVSSVEKWGEKPDPGRIYYAWLHNMHRMIDTLAEGKSIEEFLETSV